MLWCSRRNPLLLERFCTGREEERRFEFQRFFESPIDFQSCNSLRRFVRCYLRWKWPIFQTACIYCGCLLFALIITFIAFPVLTCCLNLFSMSRLFSPWFAFKAPFLAINSACLRAINIKWTIQFVRKRN